MLDPCLIHFCCSLCPVKTCISAQILVLSGIQVINHDPRQAQLAAMQVSKFSTLSSIPSETWVFLDGGLNCFFFWGGVHRLIGMEERVKKTTCIFLGSTFMCAVTIERSLKPECTLYTGTIKHDMMTWKE